MLSRFVFFLIVAAAATPVRADHESAETILNAWTRFAPRRHTLQPAKEIRQLPPSTNKVLIDRVSADARSFLSDQMAVVMVENGELVFEAYGKGAAKESPLNSYSMTKSMTALAAGEALCAGKLKSLDDKAAIYEPALEGTTYGAASIRNLLRYTSGAQDPGGNGYTGIHNGDDFRAMIQQKMSLIDLMKKYGGESRFKQGEKFIYNGLDSQALGVVVRGATGIPMQSWFEATVWQKAGAEYSAGWFMDRDGNAVAEITFLATARDFARVGLYVLDRLSGKVQDPCVSAFLREAATAQVRKGYWDAAPSFGLGLHVGADGNTWMFGHGGQRVGINVKTGRVLATNGHRDWRNIDTYAQGLLAR